MSVIFHFSRQLPKSSLRKNWLEIRWPIFRLVSSSSLDLFSWRISHKNSHCQYIYIYIFEFLTWIFLYIDFASCVLTVLIKESKVRRFFSLLRFWSRREIKKSLEIAVLGRIYLKSRSDIKAIPKLAGVYLMTVFLRQCFLANIDVQN